MSATVPRRSILVAAAVAGVTCLPTAGLAQPKRRVYRVGVFSPPRPAFVSELSRRGYTEGINIVFEIRLPLNDQASELERAAGELVKANVDLIYINGGTRALAAKKATSTIPIVFYNSPDPVGLGLVRSLSHPEANLTGSSNQAWDTNAREIQLLAEASGRLTSLALIMPTLSNTLLSRGFATPLINTATALGIRIQFVSYESVQELEPMVERLAREGVDGVGVGDTPSESNRKVAALLIKLRLPSIGNASDGYLLGYEYSSDATDRIAARQVDQILKGAKSGALPIEQASTFELAINLRTAKAIGLSIPSSVLLQATKLIQ